jgi:HEAT repeat protein
MRLLGWRKKRAEAREPELLTLAPEPVAGPSKGAGVEESAIALMAVLSSDAPGYGDKMKAAEALGDAGDTQAIPLLVATLEADWLPLMRRAADALRKLGWDADSAPTKQAVLYYVGLGYRDHFAKLGPEAVRKLGDVFWEGISTHPFGYEHFASWLTYIGSPEAMAPLLAALDGGSVQEVKGYRRAVAVAEAIGWTANPRNSQDIPEMSPSVKREAVEALMKLAADNNDGLMLQEEAVKALGLIGDRRAIPAVELATKSNTGRIRLAARAALEALGTEPPPEDEATVALRQGRDAAMAGAVLEAVTAFNCVLKSDMPVSSIEPEAYLLPVFERLQEHDRAAQCLRRVDEAGMGLDPSHEDRWRAAVAATSPADLKRALES